MVESNLPYIISSVLFLLAGVGGLICTFAAPTGRKGLTGTASALMLASGIILLILDLFGFSLFEVLRGVFGFRSAEFIWSGIGYLSDVLFGVGLVLLVFAATRRLPRPSAPFTPHQPHGPHAPVGPYQHGPVQG